MKHLNSFKYAFSGLFHALLNEANFRVHILFTIITIWLGFYFEITRIEWALVVISSVLLLSAEMINTTVEAIMDHMFPEYHEVAKVVKDLAAGFVLTVAVGTLLVFVILFGERLPFLGQEVARILAL